MKNEVSLNNKRLCTVINIAMWNNFKHCHVYSSRTHKNMHRLHDFLSGKVRLMHMTTVTRSLSFTKDIKPKF